METKFDVIVIGSGVGGSGVASSLSSAGKKVAVVEEDLWGGTCPNRGCDPKKVLVSAVEARDSVSQLQGKGLETIPAINWPDLMSFKESFTNPVPEQSKKSLTDAGVETFSGSAEFLDEHTLQVNGDKLTADQFVIATGARPSLLDIPGKEYFLTSEDFLSLQEMPETVTFIGGGYIAFEFAAIANAAGAKVHLIHHNDRPLKAFDSELVQQLMEELENKGVTIHLNIETSKVTKSADGYVLSDDKSFELDTDLVFCSTGRIPNADNLQLEKAGVEFDKKGITVNDYLQTSSSHIFALGDVLAKKQPKLTPVSTFEANYLVAYLTGETQEAIAYPLISSQVFSGPKLAQIGVTTQEAEENTAEYEITTTDATKFFSYTRTNEPVSTVKVVTNKESGLIVGAACLNNEADELINYFHALIDHKVTATELSHKILGYPTIASDLEYFYTK